MAGMCGFLGCGGGDFFSEIAFAVLTIGIKGGSRGSRSSGYDAWTGLLLSSESCGELIGEGGKTTESASMALRDINHTAARRECGSRTIGGGLYCCVKKEVLASM